MSTSVGRRVLPIFAAPAAWSMRAKTFSPRCLAFSSSRFIVSLAEKRLSIATRPSAPSAAVENASSIANRTGNERFMPNSSDKSEAGRQFGKPWRRDVYQVGLEGFVPADQNEHPKRHHHPT